MSVEPSDQLKEQLEPNILEMIRQYNQRDDEITSQQLCTFNDRYDSLLMTQHAAKLNELYEEARQRVKSEAILSSRNVEEHTNQEMEMTRTQDYLEDNLRVERMFDNAAKREPTHHKEELRRMDHCRDYLFLEKVVKYYRISLWLGRAEQR